MTFYETVLEEFKDCDESYFCHGSLTFEKAWEGKTKRLKIVKKSKKFLKATGQMSCFGGPSPKYCNSLFTSPSCLARQLRLDFLEWCIKNNLDLK